MYIAAIRAYLILSITLSKLAATCGRCMHSLFSCCLPIAWWYMNAYQAFHMAGAFLTVQRITTH